jgi:outer membrane protein
MSLPTRVLLITTCLGLPTLGFAEDTPPEDWNVIGGVGVLAQPEYPGADKRKVTPAPFVVASKGRWLMGAAPGTGIPFGVAASLVQTPVWKFGAALGGTFVKERDEGDDSRLRGLGDIDGTARAALFASATVGWVKALGSVSTDIAGKDQGTEARLDAEARMPLGEYLAFTVGAGVTFVDQRRQQTFFGIDDQQSARSGRAAYRPEAGMQSVRLNLGVDYSVTPSWTLGAKAELSTLQGDAAASPITQDKRQDSYAAFVRYRF